MPPAVDKATMKVPPAPAGLATSPYRASRVVALADGSSSWTIPGTTDPNTAKDGCWVTIVALGGDIAIVGGVAGIANATLATDFVLPEGSAADYWCDVTTTTFKFASAGGAASASVYRSSS